MRALLLVGYTGATFVVAGAIARRPAGNFGRFGGDERTGSARHPDGRWRPRGRLHAGLYWSAVGVGLVLGLLLELTSG
jgi:hypothetical protein